VSQLRERSSPLQGFYSDKIYFSNSARVSANAEEKNTTIKKGFYIDMVSRKILKNRVIVIVVMRVIYTQLDCFCGVTSWVASLYLRFPVRV